MKLPVFFPPDGSADFYLGGQVEAMVPVINHHSPLSQHDISFNSDSQEISLYSTNDHRILGKRAFIDSDNEAVVFNELSVFFPPCDTKQNYSERYK